MIKELSRFFSEVSKKAKELNLPHLNVSDIAFSSVCEGKLFMKNIVGKVVTPEMVQGTYIHTKWYEDVESSPEKAESLLKNTGTSHFTMKLKMIYNLKGTDTYVLISGIPDLIIIEEGRIPFIQELKTRNSLFIKESDIVQVGIYAMILLNGARNIGINWHDAVLEVVVLDRTSYKLKKKQFLYSEVKDMVENVVENVSMVEVGLKTPSPPQDEGVCQTCEYADVCVIKNRV